jgi:hypothetical protein
MSESVNGEHVPVKVEWYSLRHDCEPPTVDVYAPGLRLRWRCPECRTRWLFDRDKTARWQDKSLPSRRWRKAQARRVRSALSGGSETPHE